MAEESVSTRLKRLGLLKRRESVLTRRKKEATKARKLLEIQLHEQMIEEDGPESMRRVAGITFTPQTTPYATVQDKAELIEYLRENDAGLIEEKLREGELNQLVREKLANGEELPPGLGYWDKNWISMKGVNAQTIEAEDEDDGE